MSIYEITVPKSAEKEIAALPPKIRKKVELAIDNLALEPRPPGVIKLKGRSNTYRVRVEDLYQGSWLQTLHRSPQEDQNEKFSENRI